MRIVQATFGVFHSFELAHQLRERGHLTKIYSTWPWARLKREGVPRELVGTFPLIHTPDYLLGRTRVYPRWLAGRMRWWNATLFDRWVERVMPECDALIGISGTTLRAGAAARRRGAKFVCDRGSSHHRYQERVLREEDERWGVPHPGELAGVVERDEAMYAEADMVTVPSTFSARTFVEYGVPAEKLEIIPYGVRLDRFHTETRPAAVKEKLEVVFAGHVSLRKGIPYLLQAFARVRHPNKRLRLAGAVDGPLQSLLGRLPTDGVEFLGPVPQGSLPEIFGSSHFLVLPSIEDGFGLVQAQAMACGCPVIASTNTGAEELFSDGREGFIVPIRNPDALAERMQRLVDEDGLRERMSVAALQRVRTLGGWDAYGERWDALLHRLTGL